MLLNILILFVAAVSGGIFNIIIPEQKGHGFRLSLVFAGSYLFSITIIHLIPGLYASGQDTFHISILILAGFFLQQVLEYFTSGIEHGHLHHKDKQHHHTRLSAFTVVIALSIHAFLEGTLVTNPMNHGIHSQNSTLLMGILLHKIPAAYALMSIVTCQLKSRQMAVLLLLFFAFASPAGLFLSDITYRNQLITDQTFTILFALVSGSFLHISTTIVFESNPQHAFGKRRFSVAVIGALAAIVFEYLLK